MSLTNSPIWFGSGATGGSFYDYQINDSLRFNDDDSAYLNRTPSSAGNRKTWTWSGWVKRGNIKSAWTTLFASVSGSQYTSIGIKGSGADQLRIVQDNGAGGVYELLSNAILRDTSAWYHIVVAMDTTQATSSDRIKFYINGEQQSVTGSYPSQNLDTWISNTQTHYLGGWPAVSEFLDGYLSEVNFIDGQALAPTSFGNTKNGVWIPKAYGGSYGTNGFKLNFSDNSTATNLGLDSSGNSNNFSVNNIATTDQMIDTPTNNFATLNVLTKGTSNTSLAEGNLKANATASPSGSNWGTVFSSITLPTTGKYYVEGRAFINAGAGNNSHLGVLDTSSFVPSHTNITYAYTTGEGFDGIYLSLFNNNAQPVSDGVLGTAEGSLTGTSALVMLAVDIDNGKVWAGYDGTWLNSGNPSAGTGEIATRTFSDSDAIAVGTAYNGTNDQGMFANFGQDSTFAGANSAGGYSDANGVGDFKYSVPSGFLALCNANLPEPVVGPLGNSLSDENFNTVLWTGDGSAPRSITGVGFQPDWVWIKGRNAAWDHHSIDVIRGANNYLKSSSADAEASSGAGNEIISSFDSDGFSLATSSVNGNSNNNGSTYVGWNWKAGGTGVSNTNGSITSTVSANTDAGFSIVTYTGNGSNATVGHGLDTAPSMIFVKVRNYGDHWMIGHSDIGFTHFLQLPGTNGAISASNAWNNTSPTSSVFSIGTTANVNRSGYNFVAYCFAEKEGFSKAGSYTGNGSTDGTYVYTGFRPAWVLAKFSSTTSYWIVFDNKRNQYNLTDAGLRANTSDSENTNLFFVDFVSNGFKIRDGGGLNSSGQTAIYLAFAEQPFKYANAR